MRREGRIRWLFLPGEPEDESDEIGHGTCVTSKVASPTFGVAKNSNLVIVKIYPIDGGIRHSRTLAALGAVVDDIVREDLQGKAVVSMALGGEQSRS